MADLNDLPDKMKELVVEEKTNGKNWNDLPFEMKEMVIKEMTYETRARLKMCSKNDKYLVESTKMSFEDLKIAAEKKEEYTVFAIALQMKNNPKLDFSLRMCAFNSGPYAGIVYTERNLHHKYITCSSGEEASMMINRFFNNIVLDRNLHFNSIVITGNYPGFLDGREFTIHPKGAIKIKGMASEVTGWLKNIAPGVKTIDLEKDEEANDVMIEGLGTIPAVMNATTFNTDYDCDINDDNVSNFKCRVLLLDYKSNITGKGINQFIKKVIANNYENAHLGITLNEITFQTWNDMIDGLDVKATLSGDYPEDEHGRVKFGVRKGYIQMSQGKRLEVIINNEKKQCIIHLSS